jgi:hypothetical protein
VEAKTLALPEEAEAAIAEVVAALDDLFAESANALSGLESYRYTTVFSFTTEVDGSPESGSVNLQGAVAGPDRQMTTWKDLETGDEFGIVRIGDEAWMQEGEGWAPVPTMVADLMSKAVLIYAPSAGWNAIAAGVEPASTYVGTETVNGISARHYASTSPAWAEYWAGKVEESTGDIWIAEAGYPVRYRFTGKTVDEEGTRATVLWTMELSDVNVPITIEPPQVAEETGG